MRRLELDIYQPLEILESGIEDSNLISVTIYLHFYFKHQTMNDFQTKLFISI